MFWTLLSWITGHCRQLIEVCLQLLVQIHWSYNFSCHGEEEEWHSVKLLQCSDIVFKICTHIERNILDLFKLKITHLLNVGQLLHVLNLPCRHILFRFRLRLSIKNLLYFRIQISQVPCSHTLVQVSPTLQQLPEHDNDIVFDEFYYQSPANVLHAIAGSPPEGTIHIASRTWNILHQFK